MSVRSLDRKRAKRNRVAYRRKPWEFTATAALIEYANACAGTGKTRALARIVGVDLLDPDNYVCCKFDVDPDSDDENTPETTWHYRRTCAHCGAKWWGLHCPHDGYQNPCPDCGVEPTPVLEIAS